MRILILHGPNMNLFGIESAKVGEKLTLDKINQYIRKYIRDKNISIKIMQTHNEAKAVSYLHKNRNKFYGLIMTPGSWSNNAYILNESLEIIDLDYVIINKTKYHDSDIFSPSKHIYNENILLSFEKAVDYFLNKIEDE
tara:strand:+ start:104 stop:520 length:417 start_codon:yes stop_codon:yes gene_type:complete